MSGNPKNTLRLRVETCIGTIIDVHNSISVDEEDNLLFLQFERLKDAVTDMDMNEISESDVLRVEQATNALLGEFSVLFESGLFGSVYGHTLN